MESPRAPGLLPPSLEAHARAPGGGGLLPPIPNTLHPASHPPWKNTHSQSCLKSFLERHGLSLLWIWMAELGDGRESNQKLQEEVSSHSTCLFLKTTKFII